MEHGVCAAVEGVIKNFNSRIAQNYRHLGQGDKEAEALFQRPVTVQKLDWF
jgi:hypothetical protein